MAKCPRVLEGSISVFLMLRACSQAQAALNQYRAVVGVLFVCTQSAELQPLPPDSKHSPTPNNKPSKQESMYVEDPVICWRLGGVCIILWGKGIRCEDVGYKTTSDRKPHCPAQF